MIVETKVSKKAIADLNAVPVSLPAHVSHLKSLHLRELFNTHPHRTQEMQIACDELTLDFSHQRITQQTLDVLEDLANKSQLYKKIVDLICGKFVNTSEQRPALHTALRDPTPMPISVEGKNIKLDIRAMHEKMREVCERLWQKEIQDVLVLGIGGSYWGSRCVCEALQSLPTRLNVHFLADIEEEAFEAAIHKLSPQNTAVIIISKSFTTQEVLCNAQRAQAWLGPHEKEHLFAVTAAPKKAQAWGIESNNILEFWSWVGGRYSVWSAVGIPIALCYGMDVFCSLLEGAHIIDQHLTSSTPCQNLPMMAALLDFLNVRYFNAPTKAIIPYGFSLKAFIPYVQQLSMESLGKCHDVHGNPIFDATGPIVWGQTGLHAQHTFNQLLHQGKHCVAIDFIIPMDKPELVSNCFARSQALALGDTEHPITYARTPGNQPHNILKITTLSPKTLGMLMAFYEHKTYLLACLFNINAFDQFGVELAKTLHHLATALE